MKAVALPSTSDNGPARKQQKTEVHAVPISPRFTQPAPTIDGPVIQRKSACACGGGCPRCAKESDTLKVQTKLAISTPGDEFEREADAVADRVMRMPAPMLQRQCTGCADASAPSPKDEDGPQIQRQANGGGGAGEVASDFTSRLGGGAQLDAASRAYFEPRFGHDFGNVRIHNGPQAARAAASIQARAFTLGRDVVFAAGEHDPGSEGGRRLLAHELTHVVQQSRSGVVAPPRNIIQRYGHKDSCPQSFLESHVWPGDALAKRMIPHALNSLCAAMYGNPTSRNKRAGGTLVGVFRKDWKSKAQPIYDNLWRLRAALDGGDYMYDCVTGCDIEGEKGAKETKFAETSVRSFFTGGPGGTIKLCHENLKEMAVEHFAKTLIHEIGHLMLGLRHGADDESGTCAGETDDAECYALLARYFWGKGDTQYITTVGDLCLGGGSEVTQQPSNWD